MAYCGPRWGAETLSLDRDNLLVIRVRFCQAPIRVDSGRFWCFWSVPALFFVFPCDFRRQVNVHISRRPPIIRKTARIGPGSPRRIRLSRASMAHREVIWFPFWCRDYLVKHAWHIWLPVAAPAAFRAGSLTGIAADAPGVVRAAPAALTGRVKHHVLAISHQNRP